MSLRPELRLITFDADQTLSDFHSVLKLALKETAAFLNEHLETPMSPQELQARRMAYANDPAHKQTPMMELRRLAIADALAGHDDQVRLTNEALALFRDIRFTKVRSMPFADDLIKQLHGQVRLGWITNGNSRPEHTGYDDLFDGKENPIDLSGVAVSNNGIELIDREFIAAIKEGREPNGSAQQVLDAMRTLDRIEKCFK